MSEVGICRCEKVKTRGGLAARDAHNRRTKVVGNADYTRRELNQNLRPDLPSSSLAALDGVLKRLGNPKLRQNGVLGVEYVMTYSPQASDRIDPLAWARSALAFVETRHGAENTLSAHLHLDEKTPHVHVVAAPVFANALVIGPFMGSRAILRKLQDDFHAQVSSHFGLARTSETPTRRGHISARELRAKSRETADLISAVKQQVETTAKQISVRIVTEPVSATSMLTSKGRDAFVRTVEQAAETRIVTIRNQILRVAAASLDELHELVASAVLLRAENLAMKTHQLQELRDIELARVADLYLGVTPRREGQSLVWETDDHKLVVTGVKFHDFKSDQGPLGGGAIDLAMHLLGCDFATAIRTLAADFPLGVAGAVHSHHIQIARQETAKAMASPRPLFAEQFARFAAPVPANLSLVRKYLSVARMIPAASIDRLVSSGDLWANRFGACTFAHRDPSGGIRGCSIRGTKGDFKQALGDKTGAWFSVGAPVAKASHLVLTESPIDALSFAALEPLAETDAILSTAGQTGCEQIIALGRPLILAQDADEAGEQQASALAAAALLSGLTVERRKPTRGKDWNEELTYDRDERQRIACEIEQRERTLAGGEREAGERQPGAARAVAANATDFRQGRRAIR